MRKQDEINDPCSYLNRGENREMIFVLLGRDAAAAATVRYWANRRVALKKNKRSDEQIQEALRCAAVMEMESKR